MSEHGTQPLMVMGQSLDAALPVETAAARAVVFSRARPVGETGNQDTAAVIPVDPERLVLAVADGVGGGPAGAQAAALAVTELHQAVQQVSDPALLREAVLAAFDSANQAVLALGCGAATTLATVVLEQGTARSYHVGDSSVLVVGQRGKIKLQTTNHSPVGYAVEAGLLDQNEALHHEDLHLVDNVLGSPQMRIELGPETPLAARDTILLGSDGLFDNLYLDEIVERVRKGPLAGASARLVADCLQRMRPGEDHLPGKMDDLTFILCRRRAPAHGTAA